MVCETDEFEMKDRGFREIDSPNNETFGVFQDSHQREVALAIEEVSTGDGHTDFSVEPVAPSVEASESVERDLKRRDLTVNAMALDLRHDVLHDPHGGVRDLEDGVIRAVDETAFRQDPLRILRAARFAARLGFVIEPSTRRAMRDSVDSLESLPQERVRMEAEKSLVRSDQPRRFFDILEEVGALETTFPALASLTQVPAGPEQYHKEGSAYEHTMMVLEQMNERRPNDELALLMALYHDIGKGLTPDKSLPSHPNHGDGGLGIIMRVAERLSLSNEQESAMKEASRYHMMLNDVEDLRESTVIDVVQRADNLDRLVDLVKADAAGRIPSTEVDGEPIRRRFSLAQLACAEWTGQRLLDEGYDPEEMGGKEFGDLLRQRRVEYMRELETDDKS